MLFDLILMSIAHHNSSLESTSPNTQDHPELRTAEEDVCALQVFGPRTDTDLL